MFEFLARIRRVRHDYFDLIKRVGDFHCLVHPSGEP